MAPFWIYSAYNLYYVYYEVIQALFWLYSGFLVYLFVWETTYEV